MAYHHNHHHHPTPPPAAPSCCCCSSSTQTHHLPTPHPPPPSPLPQPDPLLVDAVVSRLLYLHSYQTPRKPQAHHLYQHRHPVGKTPDFSSLIDRIEALEASLHRFSYSSAGSVVSVRDAAARVIQQRFRAFLARRSRILRQLQDLAVVKSGYAALRSSVSNSSYVRFERISRKVEDLLLQLDSIEEDDQMITEGKRSIGRNLDRFLRYVDGRSNEVLSSRSNSCRRTVSNARKDNVRLRAQREMVNDLRGRVERIQKMSRVLEKEERADDAELEGFDDLSDLEDEKGLHRVLKKTVKFSENGDAYRVISNSDEQSSIEGEEEDDPNDDSVEACEKFKKIEVKDSPKDEEEGHEYGNEGGSRIRGSYVFTPPVPEKMESVADSVMKKKKKKEVKS